jgi:hypothetical protein
MKEKLIYTVGAIVVATASAFAAGSQATGTSPMPQTPARGGAMDAPITVSGCVERVGSGSTATYKLTKLERGNTMGTARSGSPASRTEGTAPGSPAPGVSTAPAAPGNAQSGEGRGLTADLPREFALRSETALDFSPHADHKVEVTGRWDRRTAAGRAGGGATTGTNNATGGSSAPGTSGSAPSGGSKAPLEGRGGTNAANETPVLSVASVRMLAANCD